MSTGPRTLAGIMLAALAVWALAGWMRERRDAARQRKMFIDIMKDDSKVICMAFDALRDMAATAVKAAAGLAHAPVASPAERKIGG